MECKHYYKRKQKIAGIGGDLEIEEHVCALKETDTLTKYKVYDALFKKGLQGSFFTDDCPVAIPNRWEECPFYEKKK